jgi:aminoglycoside 2'-N-acetyltransferase I
VRAVGHAGWSVGTASGHDDHLTDRNEARVVHLTSANAPVEVLASIRELLDKAFAGEFTDDDWSHTLGGTHVLVRDGDDVVAHAAVVARDLEIGTDPFRAGYVEGVATAPSRRGSGLGSAAMVEASRVVLADFEVGVLSTSVHHFYERLGWERWQGPTFVRRGDQLTRTEVEDDGIMVLRFGPSAGLDLTAAITCAARSGDDW